MKRIGSTILGALIIAAAILMYANRGQEGKREGATERQNRHATEMERNAESSPLPSAEESEPGLPTLFRKRNSQLIHHTGYTVSYNKQTKIPNWVAWTLTPERLEEVVSRYDKFLPDPEVADPVTTDDYTRSGYDRGHLCPAADNKWDGQAMRESFYMTNVCPQDRNLNRGDWNDLEEACRAWTMTYGRLYVVAGPVLYDGEHQHIGHSRVTVPEAFFKVIFCPDPLKAVGFIYKNRSGNRLLGAYVNSVDDVERITGIDFFPSLPDSVEDAVEAVCDPSEWNMPEG